MTEVNPNIAVTHALAQPVSLTPEQVETAVGKSMRGDIQTQPMSIDQINSMIDAIMANMTPQEQMSTFSIMNGMQLNALNPLATAPDPEMAINDAVTDENAPVTLSNNLGEPATPAPPSMGYGYGINANQAPANTGYTSNAVSDAVAAPGPANSAMANALADAVGYANSQAADTGYGYGLGLGLGLGADASSTGNPGGLATGGGAASTGENDGGSQGAGQGFGSVGPDGGTASGNVGGMATGGGAASTGESGNDGSGQGQGQGQGQGEGDVDSGLGDRQRELRDMLGQLQRGLREFGLSAPGQLDGAKEAMGRAERALRQGDLDAAGQEETRALDELRQGAREMAQQMLRQMPSRFGLGPDTQGELDPMGRPPQRTDGPDPGVGVKVPDQIDVQRAREILEELRRRIGEPTRPSLELEYLERLLQRF